MEFETMLKNEAKCEYSNPVKNVSLSNFVDKSKEIEEMANKTMPIINKECVKLIEEFIKLKKNDGTDIEKKIYSDMTIHKFVKRAITKRPLSFVSGADIALLKDGTKTRNFGENIGSSDDKVYNYEYLSYDEMLISSMILISCYTYFINNGRKDNNGQVDDKNSIEEKGMLMGVIGPRFEKENKMDWMTLLVTPVQNTEENGYGKNADEKMYKTKFLRMLAKQMFGIEYFPTYKEAIENPLDYIETDIECCDTINNNIKSYVPLLNVSNYKKRLRLVYEPFIKSAEIKGINENKSVYVHAVGIGLHSWKISDVQHTLTIDVFYDILMSFNLKHVKMFNIRGVDHTENDKIKHNDLINGVKVTFTERNLADKLKDDMLLVGMFSWDSNAYVGNEYWMGHLSSSSDPRAASCSLISTLANPDINEKLCEKISIL